MNRLICHICFLMLLPQSAHDVFSQAGEDTVSVLIFHDQLVEAVVIQPGSAPCQCATASDQWLMDARDQLYLRARGDRLLLSRPGAGFSLEEKLLIRNARGNSTLGIHPVQPYFPGRAYPGSVLFEADRGYIRITNRLKTGDYLAGVAETEAGRNVPDHFYRAQLILCRTFAAGNLNRHGEQGADFCDDVHCQAFHGIPLRYEHLLGLVADTEGMVLVDTDTLPVIAAYHSNSGGYTRNSADVWVRGVPYLVSKKDVFSLGQRNATWSRQLGFSEWTGYLRSKQVNLPEVVSGKELEHFSQMPQAFYRVRNREIPFVTIRKDLEFPSDFFDIHYTKGYFRIEGKGYGHGLGLSQEGGINMARRGHDYLEILEFYYPGTRVVHSGQLPGGNQNKREER